MPPTTPRLVSVAESDRREIVELLLDRNSTIQGRNVYQETVLIGRRLYPSQ